jgi:benzoate membrane transport protein
MSDVAMTRGGWFSLTSSALTAVVVGFASTILVIMQAAQAVGATPSQQASWAAVLCFGMAVTTLYLCWAHKMPIITAWSTPGAALIATSAVGVTYANALGAFAVAGLLMALAALVKPLARAIAQIPAPLASAMLAGVLLHYTLGVPAAALAMPQCVAAGGGVFWFAVELSAVCRSCCCSARRCHGSFCRRLCERLLRGWGDTAGMDHTAV